MNARTSFFQAEAGASATLVGLIFVGVSINLEKILSVPKLPNRAFEAFLLLLTALIISLFMLVPGQPISFVGVELLVVGGAAWITIGALDILALRSRESPYRRLGALLILLNQLSVIPYLVGGILLSVLGSAGMYVLVPAILISILKATIDAWVLLVEINR